MATLEGRYKLNTLDLFSNFGIVVEEIGGVFDFPSRGGSSEREWIDEHGSEALVSESDLWFKQRKIKLNLLIRGNSLEDFVYRLGNLQDHLYNGLCELDTPYGTFNVLMKDGAPVEYIKDGFGKVSLSLNQVGSSFQYVEPGNFDGEYSIDGYSFASLGISVEKSSGQFDLTAMKGDRVTVYKEESSFVNMRMARNITLSLIMSAKSIEEFSANMEKFHGLLAMPGLRKLRLRGSVTHEVFCKDGFKINYLSIKENHVLAKFSISLREPKTSRNSVVVALLADTDGNYIVTTDNIYIALLWDKADMAMGSTYLYLQAENKPDTYLYLDSEHDSQSEDFMKEANRTFLFTDNEIFE